MRRQYGRRRRHLEGSVYAPLETIRRDWLVGGGGVDDNGSSIEVAEVR